MGEDYLRLSVQGPLEGSDPAGNYATGGGLGACFEWYSDKECGTGVPPVIHSRDGCATFFFRSVDQIPEIPHGMKGDQISVMRIVGAMIARAAEHVNIVAVDDHGGVVAALAEIAGVGDARGENPVDAVLREMEHQP